MDGLPKRIDDDTSPVEAAQYLTIALKQALRYGPYRNFVMMTWDITEPDRDTRCDACDAIIVEMSVSAASWAQVIPLIASVVNEPLDFVITVHEVSQGNYAAAVGFLPSIPSQALSQGKRVLLQSTSGSQLMHLSHEGVTLVQAVMSPASNLTLPQTASQLKQAGLSVSQRITNIKLGQFPSLPKLTKKNKRTTILRQSLTVSGFPMPDKLFEGRHVLQIHHTLPFEHWDWFMAHGINVNDLQYL